jgi:hypothetical protein
MKPRHHFNDCIEELNLEGDKIYECTNSSKAIILQLFAEKESLLVMDKLQGVPAVVYEEKIDPLDFSESLLQFEKVVETKLASLDEKENVTTIS